MLFAMSLGRDCLPKGTAIRRLTAFCNKWEEILSDTHSSDVSNGNFQILNPATGKEIAVLPKQSTASTRLAIQKAHEAQQSWKSVLAKERASMLKSWSNLVMQNQRELALLITEEQGKPLTESMAEIANSASTIEWFAEEAKRIYGDIIPSPIAKRKTIVLKQPVGVVGAITPWNFPSLMLARKISPALATGCAIVAKPSEFTPLSALALKILAHEAGIPKDLFQIVVGEPEKIGAELTHNPIVRKITFTGSTRVGQLLMAQCSQNVQKITMELGGNGMHTVFFLFFVEIKATLM